MRKWRFRSCSRSWNKWWKPVLSLGLSEHLGLCSWDIAMWIYISVEPHNLPAIGTIIIPCCLCGNWDSEKKWTCRTSQTWEDTGASALSVVPHCPSDHMKNRGIRSYKRESRYYDLEQMHGFWSQVPGHVKSGSAAPSWGAWSKSLNIAKLQFFPL